MNMKQNQIQGKLTLLFLVFIILVSLSLTITFLGIDAQKQDGLVINLAGRQRMLIQLMTRLSENVGRSGDADSHIELRETADIFRQTLTVLQFGGEAPYLLGQTVTLTAAQSPEVIQELTQVANTWQVFNGYLAQLMSASQGSSESATALQAVLETSEDFVNQADAVVRAIEFSSSRELIRLRNLQIGFFVGALLLFAVGVRVVRRSILDPLKSLKHAAGRIGTGDLLTPIEITGPEEISQLATAFKNMQAQLKTSQDELLLWAETLNKMVAQRTRELEALHDVSRDILSRLDVQEVLDSITHKTNSLLGTDVSALCLLNESLHTMVLNAHSGPEDAIARSETIIRDGIVGKVLTSSQALANDENECCGACSVIKESFRASHLAAPLRVGDNILGALCVGSCNPDAFSEGSTDILTKLANSTAVALENARLYAQAEQMAALEERQHIAADIHDGLGQTLSYLGLSIDQVCEMMENGQYEEALERLEKSRNIIDQATNDVRSSIAQLVDGAVSKRSLQDRLHDLVESISSQSGINVILENELDVSLIMPRDDTEQVVRVANEALINIQKHANTSNACVKLRRNAEHFELFVEDYGKGFDLDQPLPGDRTHFGLHIMQARASRLDGQLTVQSEPGKGTRLSLTWPLDQQEGM